MWGCDDAMIDGMGIWGYGGLDWEGRADKGIVWG